MAEPPWLESLGKWLVALLTAAGLAISIAARTASAQSPDAPPAPATPRPLQIAAPLEARLPNGLRVVVAERRGMPLVSARLLVLAGAEFDPPRLAGLSSLAAGLLTRGTRRQAAPAQAAAAEVLGGTLDSRAGWNSSEVAITVTTPKLDPALALVAQAVIEPAFAPAELVRLRAETLDELKVSATRPGQLAAWAANRMLFGDGAYGHPVTGTTGSLARITRQAIVRLHRQVYRPDNAVLVLAGDIDLDGALALARRHFGRWRAPSAPLPAAVAPAGAPSPQALTLIDMGDSGQAGVAMALPLPPAGSADQAAGEVANAVLGGGYSARLNLEIRIKRGLSYGAGSSFDARRAAGVLRASVQTRNDTAAEVLGLLDAQVDALAAQAVPEAELAARKASLIGGFSRSVETTAGLADQLVALLASGQPVTVLGSRIAALSAVDAATVQGYAKAHFSRAGRRAAVAGDARAFSAGWPKGAEPGQPSASQPLRVQAAALDLGP